MGTSVRNLMCFFLGMMIVTLGMSCIASVASAQTTYCLVPEIPEYSSSSHGEVVKIGMYMVDTMAQIEGKKADDSAFQQSGVMEIWDGLEGSGGKRIRSRSYSAGAMVIYDRLDLKYLTQGAHRLYGKFLPQSGGSMWTDKIDVTIVPEFSVDFVGTPVSGYAPLTVVFQNLSSGLIAYSEWDFGDDSPWIKANGTTSMQYTYQSPGLYSVLLMLYGIEECGYNDVMKIDYISVTESPEKTLQADFVANPLSIETSMAVQFTPIITGSVQPESFSWSFGDGFSSLERYPTHVYYNAGTYTVSLRVTGSGLEDTETKYGYITVTDPKYLYCDFSGSPLKGEVPLVVTFYAWVTGNVSADYYEWAFGDGFVLGGPSYSQVTHTYSQPGSYTVALTVYGQGVYNANTKLNYVVVDEEKAEPPCAYFSGEPRKGERPFKVYLKATCDAASITSYLWDFGDGQTATTREVSHTYDFGGVYDVSLRVYGPGGEGYLQQKAYIEVTDPDFSLHFPIKSKTPWSVVINAVFDHSMNETYTADYRVVAYTGEEGLLPEGEKVSSSENASYVTVVKEDELYGFSNEDGDKFQINGHYSGGEFLYYDGHPGYDYRTNDQNPEGLVSVYASYGGKVILKDDGGSFGVIKIDHGNRYETWYMHCSEFFVKDDAYVETGDLIATAGDTGVSGRPHLHFEVRYDGIPVDPYGWQSDTADPYTKASNKVLWHTAGGSIDPPADVDLFYAHPLDGGAYLQWNYDETPENLDGFFLYQEIQGEFSYMTTLTSDAREYVVMELGNGREYTFLLTAFNQVNEESQGKTASVVPTSEEEPAGTSEGGSGEETSGSGSSQSGEESSQGENSHGEEENGSSGGEQTSGTDSEDGPTSMCGDDGVGEVNICGVFGMHAGGVPLLGIIPLLMCILKFRSKRL